jgi:hypothetical protein
VNITQKLIAIEIPGMARRAAHGGAQSIAMESVFHAFAHRKSLEFSVFQLDENPVSRAVPSFRL